MNRFLKTMLTALALACSVSIGMQAATTTTATKEVTLTFDAGDFEFTTDSLGKTTVSTTKHLSYYSEEITPYALPLIPVSVLLPEGSTYSSFTFTYSRSTYKSGISLAATPQAEITSNSATSLPVDQPRPPRPVESYSPTNSVKYVGCSDFNGYTMANFIVSPFQLFLGRQLYFYNSITISIKYNTTSTENASPAPGVNMSADDIAADIVRSLVVNDEDVTPRTTLDTSAPSDSARYDYMIVTSPALKDAFQPLADWKTRKGVRAKIVTTTLTSNSFNDALNIKRLIYNSYKQGVKYVLLGGDNKIIPVVTCDMQIKYTTQVNGKLVTKTVSEHIPCDMFYACFDENNFDWDANNNGIYAEVADNINFTPSVYLSRTPVRTATDASNWVSKILNYEAYRAFNPKHSMLLGGTEMSSDGIYYATTPTLISDAQAASQNMFDTYIKNKWNGTAKYLFDTYADVDLVDNIANFSAKNLTNQISQAYDFIDINTHGSNTSWGMEYGTFTSSNADECYNNTSNYIYTIITTGACKTNNFDEAEPCLSESFIRNKNSGVIAYLGCSRQGWFYPGSNQLGPSMQYTAQFYKYLLSESNTNKSFGAAVAAAKMAMAPLCNSVNTQRWVQLGLNPIGDPEMPVCTQAFKRLEEPTIEVGDGYIRIYPKEPGCKICLMSWGDKGASFYQVKSNYSNDYVTFYTRIGENGAANENENKLSVCVSKYNYKPRTATFYPNLYIQKRTLGKKDFYGNIVTIGENVTDSKESGPVRFTYQSIIRGKKIILESGTQIDKDATVILMNN